MVRYYIRRSFWEVYKAFSSQIVKALHSKNQGLYRDAVISNHEYNFDNINFYRRKISSNLEHLLLSKGWSLLIWKGKLVNDVVFLEIT